MTQTEQQEQREAAGARFWDCNRDREQLLWTTIEEAVYAWADDQPKPLPETVTVYGWAEMALPQPERQAEWLLDDLLERLDEEYGDPGESTEATDEMKAAALVFVNAIHANYHVWACEQITSRVVKVADYVPAEWLTPAEAQ